MLEIINLTIRFDGKTVISDLSLRLGQGDIGCLLGPSGCGKTTLLRAIAGFERPEHGEVRIDRRCVSSPAALVPVEQRGVGMVFQDFALFPHLSARDNITFGLRELAKVERQRRIDELAQLLGDRRFPAQISAPAIGRPATTGCYRARAWLRVRIFCCWMNRSQTWI